MGVLANKMKYRYLGNSGLLVSQLALGTMMFGMPMDFDKSYETMTHAFKHDINFFDNAETYSNGQAEVIMGQAIKKGIERGVWSCEDLVISTKIFWGSKGFFEGMFGPNDNGLSHKKIIEGTRAALERNGQEYVDPIFCHRPDPRTPIEETVRAINFVIDQGWAFYWGTSEWNARDVMEACEIADRLGMARPVMDQPEYSIFECSRVDYDFVNLYQKYKYGLTIWSPLSSGVLTGKYSKGILEGSRFSASKFRDLVDMNEVEKRIATGGPAGRGRGRSRRHDRAVLDRLVCRERARVERPSCSSSQLCYRAPSRLCTNCVNGTSKVESTL